MALNTRMWPTQSTSKSLIYSLVCRGGAKAMDTDFLIESLALKAAEADDDAPKQVTTFVSR